MEVEPSTWYSTRDTHPSIDPAHWRLTSQPCLCSNHHSTWAHNYQVKITALCHYSDVIMIVRASQITSLTMVYSTVYSAVDQRKHKSSASLVIVRRIHRWPGNSLHKGPVMRKIVSIWWHHHVMKPIGLQVLFTGSQRWRQDFIIKFRPTSFFNIKIILQAMIHIIDIKNTVFRQSCLLIVLVRLYYLHIERVARSLLNKSKYNTWWAEWSCHVERRWQAGEVARVFMAASVCCISLTNGVPATTSRLFLNRDE